ncbi:MAG: hypothetical protein JHC84_21680 [Solirubrobacteraceae bacterium]|nr:hypothetical protein [Solirubrobacteraceae bacterium]
MLLLVALGAAAAKTTCEGECGHVMYSVPDALLLGVPFAIVVWVIAAWLREAGRRDMRRNDRCGDGG